ncbi:MAG: hypothetical protein ABIQ95_12060 [Bdellovibrionia bacterium]
MKRHKLFILGIIVLGLQAGCLGTGLNPQSIQNTPVLNPVVSGGGSTPVVIPTASFQWIGALTSSTVTSGWSSSSGASVIASVDGGFQNVNGFAVDSVNGFFYVVDYYNHQISKFASVTGAFVGAIGKTNSSTGTCPASGATSGWCTGGHFTFGTGDGEFQNPTDIALDIANDVFYVSDFLNYRVSKYVLSTGAYMGSIGEVASKPGAGTCPSSGVATSWCTGGIFAQNAGDGSFNLVSSLGVDTVGGSLFIADQAARKLIQVTASTGAFVGSVGKVSSSTGNCSVGVATSWCTGGTFTATGAASIDGSYSTPAALSVDSTNGFIYVLDPGSHKANKILISTGAFVGAIGYVGSSTGGPGACVAGGGATGWCTGGTFASAPIPGAGDGHFYDAYYGISADADSGFLYIGDQGANRIMKFDLLTGAFIGAKGKLIASNGTCPTSGFAPDWCTGGTFSSGTGRGQYKAPGSVYAAADGYLYVNDTSNYRIVRVAK